MANVRVDANSLPKAFAFEWSEAAAHRSGITSVDTADPPDASGGVDCEGFEYCRFDVNVTGVGFNSLDLQVLLWNARQGLWFGGATKRLMAPGRYSLVVPESRGAILFLKVVGFSGTTFSLSADYLLS